MSPDADAILRLALTAILLTAAIYALAWYIEDTKDD